MYDSKQPLVGNAIVRAICILLAFFSMPSAADLAGDKLSAQFQSQADQRNNLGYNEQQINGNGREQKATSAQDKSGAGQTMAAVTGAALIATGSAMIPSIIPSVSAAGAELVAKGAQELAQAAADGAAKDQNGAQKDMLLNQIDGTSPVAGLSGSSLPADFQNMLTSKGVNPDAFAQSVASGQIQNGNDVLKALGLSQVSGDDLAAAQNLANSKLSSTLAQANPGTPLSMATTLDENAKAGGPSIDGNTVGGGGGGGGSNGTLSENTHGAAGETGGSAGPSAVAAAGGAAEGGSVDGSAAPAGGLQGLMAGLGLGGLVGGEDADVAGKAGPSRTQLMAIGVLPPQPKQNIFQIGHRNYRSFQKWRQLRRVAQK